MYHRGRGCDTFVEQRKQYGMRAATRATHHAHTLWVDILAMGQHPVEQDIATGSLIDVGTTRVVSSLAYLLFAFTPAIEVKIDADSTHTGQRAQSLLLVLTIAIGPMAIRTDNKSMLAFLGGCVNCTKEMLPRS